MHGLLLSAIRDGNIAQVEICLKENLQRDATDDRYYKLSDDPLQQNKYRIVMAVTLFTRAAIAGGVPDQVAFALNDSYILAADRCHDEQVLKTFYIDAIRKFASTVAEYKIKHAEEMKKNSKVDGMENFMIKHLHGKITVAQVAESVGISESYAMHLFKSVTGTSIYDFIQMERLKQAKNMLKFSNYPISDISNYLTFANQSAFTKQFKKMFHCTPTEYRKKHQEEAFTVHYPSVL